MSVHSALTNVNGQPVILNKYKYVEINISLN